MSAEGLCSQITMPRRQVFFCKYNDPIYVKLEKLDIMIALASERNIDQVLLELREYATEVDIDFVRKVGGTPWLRCGPAWGDAQIGNLPIQHCPHAAPCAGALYYALVSATIALLFTSMGDAIAVDQTVWQKYGYRSSSKHDIHRDAVAPHCSSAPYTWMGNNATQRATQRRFLLIRVVLLVVLSLF